MGSQANLVCRCCALLSILAKIAASLTVLSIWCSTAAQTPSFLLLLSMLSLFLLPLLWRFALCVLWVEGDLFALVGLDLLHELLSPAESNPRLLLLLLFVGDTSSKSPASPPSFRSPVSSSEEELGDSSAIMTPCRGSSRPILDIQNVVSYSRL